MISKISNPNFKELLPDEKIVISFTKFYSKRKNAQAYILPGKVIFIASKNQNDYYDVMVHFLDLNSVNKCLIAIKKELNQAKFLMYLRNSKAKEIFNSIDEKLISQKMLWQTLGKEKLLPKVAISNQFLCSTSEVDHHLEAFFIDCFKDEWDENVSIWLKDFNEFKEQKGILSLQDTLKNQIASSIMYWNFKDYIYVFLIGTKTEYRRLNLGHFLMKEVQENFPNKPIQLTSYKDAIAYKFYQKLGFKDGPYSGLWF